jgi:hypothetical protein
MAKRYSTWKNYKREKKKFAPIRVGDRFNILTVIEIQPQKKSGYPAVIVCRCECSVLVKTHAATLRKGFIGACERCARVEKKRAHVERPTSAHADLPQRPKWEWVGDEESLIAEAKKHDAK